MAKPIALIYFDSEALRPDPYSRLNEIKKVLEAQLFDYHVLCIPISDVPEMVRLQVFYEKDFTEIQYEELKALINNSINEIKK